jgi:hypothetical protein
MSLELTYPNGPTDHEGILKYANSASDSYTPYWFDVERLAQRAILYYAGYQWIKHDNAIRGFRPIAMKRSTPRPVTNKVAPCVNQAVSNIVVYRPPVTYTPATDEPADVAAARVADRVNMVLERETRLRFLKPIAARWVITTGNVFLVSSYDNTFESGAVQLQSEQCVQCQGVFTSLEIKESMNRCPGCGGMAFIPASDPLDQTPITTEYPKGRHLTQIESVFTCRFDPEAETIQESPYFLITKMRTRDWVERMYGVDFAEKVQYQNYANTYGNFLQELAYTTTGASKVTTMASSQNAARARVRQIWIRPRRDLAPEGIYAVIVGETVASAGPYPHKDDRGEPLLPVVHIGHDQVPGRLLCKSRVDDIIPKQDQRNRIEAMIELHLRRSANSYWTMPEGAGVTKLSGEMGFVLRYNAMSGVPAPQRVPGENIPPYFMTWLQMIDQEIDSIFGLFEVGRGETPRGVAAYSAMALLDERSQQGQSNLMENWSLGWLEWSKQNLSIWRQCADETRTLSLGVGPWSVEKFTKADLQGAVDMEIETGVYRPTTGIGRRAALDNAVRLALINPQDPIEKYKALQLLNIEELSPDHRADMEQASRNLDKLVNGQPIPPPEPWENHAVALAIIARYCKSEQFEALDPTLQEMIKAFAGLHYKFLAEAAMTNGNQGQVAPKPSASGGSKGSAKGDNMGTEEGQLEDERQGASPDTNGGV